MLTHLHIRRFAIIDDTSLELGGGMTALTGETGAGKSILLGALGQVLGERASSLSVQQGAARAEIAASFRLDALPEVRAWLVRHELDGDEDEDCVLRRTLGASGKSRASINGTPVSLRMLGELGARLVGIHGQHAHQLLGRPAEQRRLLDAWSASRGTALAAAADGATVAARAARGRTGSKRVAKATAKNGAIEAKRVERAMEEVTAGVAGTLGVEAADAALEGVREAHAAWSAAEERHRRAVDESQSREQRIDLLRFQLQEFDELDIGATPLADIESEHRWLANVERLRQLGEEALGALDDGAGDALAQALRPMRQLATIDERLREALDLVESAAIQTEEAARLLRSEVGGLEHDDARLAWLDTTLGRLHALAKKHRCDVAGLADVEQSLREELDTLTGPGATADALERERDARLARYLERARALSARRRRDAKTLAAAVTETMQTLAMEGGALHVDVAPDERARAAHGIDTVTFLVSLNPGVAPAPLGRIASGGELSRIGLCLQLATIGSRSVPTLVFDEVDAGIGGAVAETVGQLLRRVGASGVQVLCVTHLPQVAAQAHHHVRVTKRVADGRTRTELAALEGEAARDEIARMLGGARLTERSRQHAQEMLDSAR